MNCRVNRSDPDAAVAPRRYGLDPLLPALGHHSMSGIRGDILDVSTPLVGGCAALPFDRYTVEEADHERYRCGSDPGQGRLRRRLAYGPVRTYGSRGRSSWQKAAIKAMLVNRVGDFGLAPGISGCFTLFQTVDFSTIFACASAPRNSWISCNMRLNAITLICILLLIGAVGKSAQIGSHTWSPDAMEGPTPVSALIHAATMVTAGVFMIASQLGYMIFACGISNYSVSVFHLMNHAFFKALLFLSAGSVIHAMSDEQDMRKMGGLASSFPFTYAMMLMGSLSLIGFPFLTGFYSKDVILELAYTKYTISGNFAFWLGSVSVLFTSYYSFRSLFLTFLVPTNSFGRDILRCHDAPIPMAIPLILLALGSLFVGYFAKV
ncbi:UNVERIFIED_CONTAM: NADH-ubiquinone oxidoreductase chain 5 [Sesamum calycinum]|uniref:NADH-ubiquinone oxidoreductase chain 5 n=1 Tax=Sesamum calycinum TaxID=2727403 RepID=A0AAW2JKS0_9LAMI